MGAIKKELKERRLLVVRGKKRRDGLCFISFHS